jgi:pyruvate dehydrogenase E2 component (dihydrolipoamide acetyltransferase)
MAKLIGLPKLSPTMEEGTLAKWSKQEGDKVSIDDLLAEVETDKATMEFRSFDKGVLLKILAPEGSVLVMDAPVAIIGKAGEDISALIAEAEAWSSKTASAPEEPASQPDTEPAPKVAPAAPAPVARATPAPVVIPRVASSGRVMASPLVRRLARERSIDLARIPGTGPRGRIIKRDLDAALSGVRPRPPRRAARAEPLSSMRRTIARRLTESKQQVPHFYLTVDIDAEPLMAARADVNQELAERGEKVSVNDLIIKAVAVALGRMPEVNASFMGDSIHYHQNVDVSVAVSVPDGLVTPVIRDADYKSVSEISREVKELAGRARDKKLMPEEMMNGTFSVSNLGMFGVEEFSAVINPPEGAILAVGTVREEPVVRGGAVVPGKRMRMTMSCDHRVIDGALGAQWLKMLTGLLEHPIKLFL